MFDLKDRIRKRRERKHEEQLESLDAKLKLVEREARCAEEEKKLRDQIRVSEERVKAANKSKRSLLGDGLKGASVLGKGLCKGAVKVAENCGEADFFEQPKAKKRKGLEGGIYDDKPMF